jgi:modulator of FtsH protease HflC
MKWTTWTPVALAALIALFGSFYIVAEGQSAIVLNLGTVVRSGVGPGLHFKIPLVETARIFDRRLQVLDANPERYLTSDKQDISLDFFAIGQIQDVRAFYRATGGDEEVAVQRLAPIIKNALTGEINSRTLQQVVSGNREQVVARQLDSINKGASTLGVRILDIRIKRVDLPEDSNVLKSVYDQMRSQRQQVASQLRAEGVEQAQKIRAEADRQRQVLVAEAERDAQELRGEGDAKATAIYAGAYGRDPAFYAFHRSLQAYREAFADGNAVISLDPSDPFLQYMRSDK